MYLRKLKIVSVRYEVTYSKRNKMSDVKFFFELSDGMIATSYASKLNKMAFRIEPPFTNKQYGYSSFSKQSQERQIELLEIVVKKITGYEIEICFYKGIYYDTDVIKTVFNSHVDHYMWPIYCWTNEGYISVFKYENDSTRILQNPFMEMKIKKDRAEKLYYIKQTE